MGGKYREKSTALVYMRAISQIFQLETRRSWHDSVLNLFDEHVHGNATSSDTAAFVSYTNSTLQSFQYSRKEEIDPTIYRNSMIHDEREEYTFVITNKFYYIREKEREMFIFTDDIFTYLF